MFRPIVVALSGLILWVGLAYESAAQQAPSAGAQPPAVAAEGQVFRLLLRCFLKRPGNS